MPQAVPLQPQFRQIMSVKSGPFGPAEPEGAMSARLPPIFRRRRPAAKRASASRRAPGGSSWKRSAASSASRPRGHPQATIGRCSRRSRTRCRSSRCATSSWSASRCARIRCCSIRCIRKPPPGRFPRRTPSGPRRDAAARARAPACGPRRARQPRRARAAALRAAASARARIRRQQPQAAQGYLAAHSVEKSFGRAARW